MNKHQNRAGQSTREMADKRYKNRVWFVLLMIGGVLLLFVVFSNSSTLGITGVGVLGLVVLMRLLMEFTEAKAKAMRKEERRAARGARAEEAIGLSLEDLGEDYLILHDIESPYGNIDHIVISQQSGVFLIETKAHGGRVSVTNRQLLINGHLPEKDFIAQALRNTYWLKEEIQRLLNTETSKTDIWITPILVFTNAFVERMAPIKGVSVINRKYLLVLLQKPNVKPQNLAIWESREKIQEALYQIQTHHER